MKKNLLLCCALLGLVPIACLKSPTSCGRGNSVRDFHIKSFDIKTTDLSHNKIDTTSFSNSDSTAKSITVATRIDAFQKGNDFSFFINTANACDPRTAMSVESISKITIISSSNFALERPADHISAGDTITNKFIVSGSSGHGRESIENYIAEKNKIHSSILLRLSRRPYKETYFKFNITIQLSDNSIHIFNDQSLRVK